MFFDVFMMGFGKKWIAVVCAVLTASGVFAQLNMDSVGRVDYMNLRGTYLNDIWGYVDEFGNEYALVGAEKGTSIVDITTPQAPQEVFWEPGMQSIWRDLKTWGDYAYVTTEALNGLLIIDLSPLPASTALPVSYYTGPVGSEWQSAHNLYIDEYGYAYVFGANRGGNGVIILDLNTDPMNPQEVGVFDQFYVHDGYAANDTLYLAHIYDGFFSIVDVSDRSNPSLISTSSTPSNFSHNIWVSDNGNYAFTTDEVSDGYIGAYDISNPANIVELDRIQSSPGADIIPHNTHFHNNFLVTSYYSDGVVVHDVTHPYNMIEVGNYDTYPLQTPDFDGCWGAYPFFPSGLVLATDRSEGLFILQPTYTQASYLEGTVTDASTTNPLGNVSVQIVTNNQIEQTANTGFYATGIAQQGTYDVTYSKVGYIPQTFSLTLTSGVITYQDVQLVPIPPYSLTVNVVEEGTGNPVMGADIELVADLITHSGSTNGIGEEGFTLYYEEVYDVIVGKWGYFTYCNQLVIDQNTGSITIELPKGYYDDFTFDFGWSVTGSATSGMWERGVPYGTNGGSQANNDVQIDCGDKAFVTGNTPNVNPDLDDVDNGTTALISPVMDLSSYTEPYVNYTRWFYCQHGPFAPDDQLIVTVSNGLQTVVIDTVGPQGSALVDWEEVSLKISDFVSLTSTMQFIFFTSDLNPAVNITEAGVDRFFIAEEAVLSLSEEMQDIRVYPNPSNAFFFVEGVAPDQQYELYSLDGVCVQKGEVGDSGAIDVRSFQQGMYVLKMGSTMVRLMKVD